MRPARAAAISFGSVSCGEAALTATTSGMVPIIVTGARSDTESKGRLR